jgi:hypothetical protein
MRQSIKIFAGLLILCFTNFAIAEECTTSDKVEYAKIGMTAAQITEVCDKRKEGKTAEAKDGKTTIIINNVNANTNTNTNNNSATASNSDSQKQRKSMEQFYFNVSYGLSSGSGSDSKIDFQANIVLGFWYFFNQPYHSGLVVGYSGHGYVAERSTIDDSDVNGSSDFSVDAPTLSHNMAYIGYNFSNSWGDISLIPFIGRGSGNFRQTYSYETCSGSFFQCSLGHGEARVEYTQTTIGIRFFDVQNASYGSTWYVELLSTTLSYGDAEVRINDGGSGSTALSGENTWENDKVTSINLGFTW